MQKSIVGHLFLLLLNKLQYHLPKSVVNPHQMVFDIEVICASTTFIIFLTCKSLVNLAHLIHAWVLRNERH